MDKVWIEFIGYIGAGGILLNQTLVIFGLVGAEAFAILTIMGTSVLILYGWLIKAEPIVFLNAILFVISVAALSN